MKRTIILLFLNVLVLACQDQNSNNLQDTERNEGAPNIVIFFTDDMGFADLGVQNQLSDVKTPNIDLLAFNGVQFTSGYVTAPQCVPSRAAMATGIYQQRFGVDDNNFNPMPLDVETIAQRMQSLGYATGFVGKWHLEIDKNSKDWFKQYDPLADVANFNPKDIPLSEKKKYFPNNRGYSDTYFGYLEQFWATYDKKGNDRPESYVSDSTYRLDAVNEASIAFIERHVNEPFYLNVAHFAPHVPLQSTAKYLARFPQNMKERRKYALSMISAIDDGVGMVVDKLREHGILQNTLIFFISDNGAPLGLDMNDAPIEDRNEAWNGSMNTPLIGEKGMLTDGGIRVPFIMHWPKVIEQPKVISEPVISLDAVYTALQIAGADDSTLAQLDGLDLIPAATQNSSYLNERPLYWRFWSQRAIRKGHYKYLDVGGNRQFLFDYSVTGYELEVPIEDNLDIARELEAQLDVWESGMPREMRIQPNSQEVRKYSHFFPFRVDVQD
ncbi:sulfatase-like hydrolase/transferase [Neiella sp. HB171785]|uniref:Sulfatase-like hydrolase/transferase n=1 Tax=Neiella litorisoli TaxID=2771431 RepID=A0A8J6UHB1_9GAMM|nr:sulfatase-like hydrolase/transferase [Neiella litorisoli]MBD1391456.1 sulfatase-like hydrolase/transferase [Neiella litorisoli]